MELRQREEALLDRTRQLTDLLYLAQRLRTSSSAPSAAAPAEHLSPAALLRSALVEPLRKLRTSRSIDECHRRQAFANSPRSPALTRSAPATPAAVLAGALEGRAPFAKALFADEGLEQRIHVCSSPSSAASSALSASLPRGGGGAYVVERGRRMSASSSVDEERDAIERVCLPPYDSSVSTFVRDVPWSLRHCALAEASAWRSQTLPSPDYAPQERHTSATSCRSRSAARSAPMTRADVLSAGAEPLPTRPVCASAVGESAALEEDAALAATAAGKSAQTRHVPGLESVLSEVLLHPDALKAVQAAQKEDSEDACAFGSPALPAYHARLVAAAGLNGRSHPVSRGLPSATDDLRVARRLAKAEDHESAPQKAKGAGAEGRCERGGIGGKRYRSPPVSSNSSPTFLRGDYLPAQAAPEAEALSRSAKRAKSQRWAWDDDPAFRIQDPATWSKESIAKYIDDLVLHGPPQCDFTHFVPPLTNKRRFSLRELCVGIEERRQDRKWMLYSTSADAVFCFPCLLFSPRVSKFVSEGFCLWRNQGKRYREHETSSEHRAAVMKLDIRRKAITDSCIVLSLLQKVGRAGLLPLDDGTPVPA